MEDKNEIIINADNEQNKGFPDKNTEKEINSLEKDNFSQLEEEILRNKSEENQLKNEISNNSENINITENIETTNNNEINNNNLLYQLPSSERKENIDKKIISQKESTTTINNTNINDLSTIPTKEEQNIESNIQNQNIKGPKNNNIIDEAEEYKSIENILNSRENNITRNINNNIFNNNNNIYFTETNIPSLRLKNVLQKSSSTKLYTISAIPEYPNGYQKNNKSSNKEQSNTADRADSTKKIKKNDINEKLNNISPNAYMRKRYVNKYNFKPLLYRIKKIEEEIIKQNHYDYQRVMKELQIKYDKDKKNKEKEKNILEYHKKLEEKLNQMEQKRTLLYNQRLENITRKQHHLITSNPSMGKINSNNNFENNLSYNSQNIITSQNKNTNTIESYGYSYEKNSNLPPLIPNLPKYKLVKIMKNKIEEQFCNDTRKRLKEIEITHRLNYLKKIQLINSKLSKQNKIYRQRSMQCLLAKKNKDASLEEEYIEKDMIKRYNIRQILQRERSAKNERIKKKFIINYDSMREKREYLEKEDEKKIQQTIKRLNRDMKKYNYKGYNSRDFYANLQKKNYEQYKKLNNAYYKDLIIRQADNVLIINELQKDEPNIRQIILKRSLKEQNKKSSELKSLDNFLEKMNKININNQTEEKKTKLFKKKIKEEEQRSKEEDNKLLKK